MLKVNTKKPKAVTKKSSKLQSSFRFFIIASIIVAIFGSAVYYYINYGCDLTDEHEDLTCQDIFMLKHASLILNAMFYLPHYLSKIGISNYAYLFRQFAGLLDANKTESASDIYNLPIIVEAMKFNQLPVFSYTPTDLADKTNHPALLYFHGGGGCIGSAKSYDAVARTLVNYTGVKMFLLEYRKSPEFLFPIPQEDCLSSLIYLYEHSEELRINIDQIFIGGDSFGAFSALYVALKWNELGLKIKYGPIRALLLTYPPLQFVNYKFPSALHEKSNRPLPYTVSAAFRSLHISGGLDIIHLLAESKLALLSANYSSVSQAYPELFPKIAWTPPKELVTSYSKYSDIILNPYVSILLQPNFYSLPDTFFASAEYDTLFSEGHILIDKCKRDSVSTEYIVYPKMFHGFISSLKMPITKKYYGDVGNYVKSKLAFS